MGHSLPARLVGYDAPDSYVNKLRDRRFTHFMDCMSQLDHDTLRILDVGGTEAFWRSRGLAGDGRFEITVLNLTAPPSESDNIESVAGDATDMRGFPDDSFDIVYSNSVIEHLATLPGQSAMAREVRRTGRYFYVQTPARAFPIEPHVLLPGFQFLPTQAQRTVLSRTSWARQGKLSQGEADALVHELRLLRKSELKQLFPGAQCYTEWFGPLPKSYTMHNFR